MNPLFIFLALAVAWFSWSLIRGLRAGEFNFGNGSRGRTVARVRRDTNPGAFWTIVAFHVILVLYVASFGFDL
jgi:hypothetical protein